MSEEVKSFCRNCSALCAMDLEVEDNRIIAVSGDGSASPYGAYMCVKGRNSAEFHSADERLVNTLKRDENGKLQPVDVDLAMDEIASQLKSLLERHGPRSIALYHGTGAYRSVLGGQLEKSFLSAIGSPNLFSTMTIDQSAKWVTMGRMGVMASGKPALDDIDLAVVVGNNPVVSHQTYPFAAGESGAPGKAFMAAKARGMKLVVVDPRRTETARLADLHIQPRPGQDAALFAGVAHILLRDDNYNRGFCDQFVSQIEALKTATAAFTPAHVAPRCDISVDELETLAQWIADAKRPFVGSGTGPSMSAHSNLNDHMIEVVNALVGGYRREGDELRNPGILNPRKVVEMAISPTRSWERGPKCRSEDIGQLFGEFPTALLPREISEPGSDKIRALIVFGGDPLMALGDPEVALPAFESLDLLVCLDARVNETGKVADYVVATSQPFERHELSIPGDGLYPRAFAQYTRPVIDMPPGVIHDWAFFWQIAARMGLPLTLKYWSYGKDFDAIKEGLPLDMDLEPDPEAMFRYLAKDSVVPFDELLANPQGVQPALPKQYVRSAPEGLGGRLALCPDDVAAELAELAIEPAHSGPYFLCCRRILEAMNSAYRDSPRTRRRYPVNWAYMHPDEIASLGLEPEDEICIQSEHGQITGIVKADPGLRRDVISMTHMFGELLASGAPGELLVSGAPREHGGSNVGRLTSLRKYLEPINFMPRYSGVPVSVSRAVAVD